MALITNNISGSASNLSQIGITGSVIIANRSPATFPAFPGTDVTFFVSGSTGVPTGKAAFGGDVVVSGSFFTGGNVVEITGSLAVTGSMQITGSFSAIGDLLEMSGTVAATQGFSGSLTKLTDGTSYLIAGSNIAIASASNGAVTISSTGGGGGTTVLQFFAGVLPSASPSGSMESVGMDYLDTTSLPPTPTYTFSAILAPTVGTTAYMDLYDYDGIIGGTPNPIAGAVLTGSSTSYTYLTADVTSALSLAGSSGIIEARIWCSPTGSGLNAICKSAKLTIS